MKRFQAKYKKEIKEPRYASKTRAMNIDKSNYKIVLNHEDWVERQIDDTRLFLSIEAWLLKEINQYGCLDWLVTML
jgi:hypothetical protein